MGDNQLLARSTRTLLPALVGVFMSLAFAQQAPGTSTADLPVTRLVLFTNGVGYFV